MMKRFWILLLLFVGLAIVASQAAAQNASCPAIVWYGEPGGVAGKDAGLCDSSANACATLEYALSQGQSRCSQEVAVMYFAPGKQYQAANWVSPSGSLPALIGYWWLPLVALVVGLAAGWWWQVRSQGGMP